MKVIKLFFSFGLIINLFACGNDAPTAAEVTTEVESEKQALQEELKSIAEEAVGETDFEQASVQSEVVSEKEAIENEIASLKEEESTAKVEKVIEKKVKKTKKKKSFASTIAFEKTTYNFGTVDEGELITYQFFFKNTGKKNLLIKNATATCGCTVPSYPKVPIEPEEESYIRISFNTKAKKGAQKPVVKVFTNARKAPYELYLEGNVIPKTTDADAEENAKEENGE